MSLPIDHRKVRERSPVSDTILVVDDEASIRRAIVKAFPDIQVLEASSLAEALEKTQEGYPDLVLLDQQLPDGTGLEALSRLRSIDPELPIVLLTGHGSTDLAVDALKQGVSDYIEKPFKLERLRLTVGGLLERQDLGRQVARLSGVARGRTQLVHQSASMKRVMGLIKRVAAVPVTTVLIQGESGVGKELVAKAIHERSSRSKSPFVAINCAALSENLLEAELFGYERGAFTGADAKGKLGLFQAAEGGTVFLDEVGEMPLNLQTKLLRVLQERCVRRVGGLDDIPVDVRVVAATNRDLREEVAAGRFRTDLYYRLRVVPILVPPLRERPADILPIAESLLTRLSSELGRPSMRLSEDARQAMEAYAWPGNVRELANAVERGVIAAADEVILPDDLILDETLPSPQPSDDAAATQALPPGSLVIPPGERNLAAIERMVVAAALHESGGQKSRAADLLGINRTTLYNKLKDLEGVSSNGAGDGVSDGD
ncbi:MAG: sigma-54-dependent Fis family transcriptional regulator [Planctomycetota bacterium]|nr:MAG: sigma-54-dependent Fis family transcriptional regulator [Planctomycetota bacterium]